MPSPLKEPGPCVLIDVPAKVKRPSPVKNALPEAAPVPVNCKFPEPERPRTEPAAMVTALVVRVPAPDRFNA